MEIIASDTDWDKRGWDYLCCGKGPYDLIVGAQVFVYVTWYDNPKEYVLDFRRVEETAELHTPDGTHFIAHSHIPHGWWVKYRKVKRELAQVGLTGKKVRTDRYLSRSQIEVLCRLLRLKPEALAESL